MSPEKPQFAGMPWEKFVSAINYRERPSQKTFYERTMKGLAKGSIIVNPASMGIGKTMASLKAIIDLLAKGKIKHAFVATPKANIKNEWIKELKRLKLPFSVLYSKRDYCLSAKAGEIMEGAVYAHCQRLGDDCPYRSHLEENKDYTDICKQLSSEIDFPLDTQFHVQKELGKTGAKEKANCLHPLLVCRAQNCDIVVGDYFYMLSGTGRAIWRGQLKKNPEETALIVDEAHLLPDRAKQMFSRALSFPYQSERLRMEIESFSPRDWIMDGTREKVMSALALLESMMFEQLGKIKDAGKREARISLAGLMERVNLEAGQDEFGLDEFIYCCSEFSTRLAKTHPEIADPACARFTDFFNFWEEIDSDSDSQAFSPYTRYMELGWDSRKHDTITVCIDCLDPAVILDRVWKYYKSASLQSGTLQPSALIEDGMGIPKERLESLPQLTEWNLREHVRIYAAKHCNFKYVVREKNFPKSVEDLKKVLKKIEDGGRTLIFVQNMKDGEKLASMLSGFEVHNLMKRKDAFERAKAAYDSSKKGIAIIHAYGQVEGLNFLDLEKNPPKGIVVFGMPLPNLTSIKGRDLQKYFKHKFGRDKWFYYSFLAPAFSRVLQQIARAKRKRSDNPTIILWDERFGSPTADEPFFYYNLLPEDLKGKCFQDVERLIGSF